LPTHPIEVKHIATLRNWHRTMARTARSKAAVIGSRRLTAIAFVDIVGYSILMSQSEGPTYVRWMTLLRDIIRPAVARHHGNFVKSTGDGLLATFTSAIDAVQWACAVQNDVSHRPGNATGTNPLPPIALRIAVHIGDVLADPDGDIFGDGVNIAARLQEHASPGGIVLSEAVHDLIRGSIKLPIRELGQLTLKNIARPVRAYLLESPISPEVPRLAPVDTYPSIAVLPLQNLSGNRDQEYFAEGIVEDIITSLAGLRELLVIARGSTMGLARKEANLREIGRALGVRYALTGSVRRTKDYCRISVQLSDVTTGGSIWASKVDTPLTDLFAQQDQIVEAVVGGIAPQVQNYELRRALRKRPENFTAYDLTLQAVDLLHRYDKATFPAALTLLHRAIDEDPRFAMPHAWAAFWHGVNIGQGWSADPNADSDAVGEHSRRAIDLDPDNAFALAVHAHNRSYLFHDYDSALIGLDRALAAGPSNPFAWCFSAATLSFIGRAEEALARVSRGLRLSPFDPQLYYFYCAGALACYALADYEGALKWARMSAALNPRFTATLRFMAMSQHALGDTLAARITTAEMLRLEPEFSLERYLQTLRGQPFSAPDIRERWTRDLTQLGLPP
jgi:adenylate cyclase